MPVTGNHGEGVLTVGSFFQWSKTDRHSHVHALYRMTLAGFFLKYATQCLVQFSRAGLGSVPFFPFIL